MKFKSFLLERDDVLYKKARSTPISSDEFMNLIKTEYSEAYDQVVKGNMIFRGTTSNEDIFITDPKIDKRMSANTSNYYTLIIDRSKKWLPFPKRSKSIICSTDLNYAKDYGSVYVVLPKNGAKIGVCPADDLWNSFDHLMKYAQDNGFGHAGYSLGDFTSTLTLLFDEADIRVNDTDYNKFASKMKELMMFYSDEDFDVEELSVSPMRKNYITKALALLKDGEEFSNDIMQKFDDLLDPSKNNITLQNIKTLNVPHNKEVWTDSESILIKMSTLSNLLVKIQ